MRTSLVDRLNAGGLSLVVGTVDQEGMPGCCRAVGVRSSPDASQVTVFVPVATSQTIVTNLASNGRVAVVFSEPVSHETIQLKGTSTTVRLAAPDEKEIVRRQMEKFAEILDQLGMPRRITSRVNRWPAFAIEIAVEKVFDQTPGPKAGSLVR